MVSLPVALPVAGLGERVVPGFARTRWRRALAGAVACGDAAAAAIAVGLAFRIGWFVASVPLAGHGTVERPDWVVTFALAPVWVVVLATHGAYDTMGLSATAEHFRRVLRSGASLVALVAVWHMLTDGQVNGLSVLGLAGLVSVFTLAARAAVQRLMHSARKQQRHLLHRAVLYGSRVETTALAMRLRDSSGVDVEIVAIYTTDEDLPGRRGCLAGVEEQQDGVVQLISVSGADVLAVASGVSSLTLRRLAWAYTAAKSPNRNRAVSRWWTIASSIRNRRKPRKYDWSGYGDSPKPSRWRVRKP